MVKKIKACRICNKEALVQFLPLGRIPLPNGFIEHKNLKKIEARYPLNVALCTHCGLVQLLDIVDPEEMFHNYVYIPSTSKTRMNNFAEIASQARQRFAVTTDSLVIDIGSNDGSLLSFFKGHGIKTLGIDPAENLAKIAELKGIETVNDYVSARLARKLRKAKGGAKVITATNVVAHIKDLHDLLSAVEILLADDGVFICEFPYLLDLIQNNQFDTIYHEHLSYFSIKPLLNLLSQVELECIDIERTAIDGGSLRVFLAKKKNKRPLNSKIAAMQKAELVYGLGSIETFNSFADRVRKIRTDLHTTLADLKSKGKTIAAYGAAAKGNILLNYCKIGNRLIDFIADSTPYKQGLYTPGTHIPIYPESEILGRMPDYILITAWNFAKEIKDKEKKYTAQGGKFIIPVPAVTIL